MLRDPMPTETLKSDDGGRRTGGGGPKGGGNSEGGKAGIKGNAETLKR